VIYAVTCQPNAAASKWRYLNEDPRRRTRLGSIMAAARRGAALQLQRLRAFG